MARTPPGSSRLGPTTDPTVPIWSYPPLLASYLIDLPIFQIAMVVLFAAWFLGWSGTLFLSSTRMIFAAAFDRILPERAAQVSENRGVPITALLFIMVPAIIVSVLYAFSADFRALTLDATLVTANLDQMTRVPGLRVEDWSQS